MFEFVYVTVGSIVKIDTPNGVCFGKVMWICEDGKKVVALELQDGNCIITNYHKCKLHRVCSGEVLLDVYGNEIKK